MEAVNEVPGPGGVRPVWLAHLESIRDWPELLADPAWLHLVNDRTRPFALFTASGDPAGETAWHDFADYCVQHDLALVCSWGPNTTVLDDVFDMAAVVREVDDLPMSSPITMWDDDGEPLVESLSFFLSYNLTVNEAFPSHPEWDRVAVVVGSSELLADVRRHLLSLRVAAR